MDAVPSHVLSYVDVYLVSEIEVADKAMVLAAKLREQMPNLRLQMHMGGGKMKKQMKQANESSARFAFILGENEITNGQVSIKDLRDNAEQISLSQDEAANWLTEQLKA